MGASKALFRKTGAVGLALTAYDIWRRIPPQHRRTIIANARKHGPRMAKAVATSRRKK